MPVNLGLPEGVLPVPGVRLGTARAGLRKTGEADVVVIALDEGTAVVATFTRNRFCAAPVHVARRHLADGHPRFLLINAGNANAGTGAAGFDDARECCRGLARAAEQAGLPCGDEHTVVPFSTGVIGQRLPADRIVAALPEALDALDKNGWVGAARAIMTTDTLPKAVSRRVETAAGPVTVTGMAKGAGMICPDMATMLGFVATDAPIEPDRLRVLHSELVGRTFNRISIDGDTSTNDACVLMATGRGSEVIPGTADWENLKAALHEVYRALARAIVRDGEGVTKFVSVNVSGAVSEADGEQVARTVAHSPLVKTALYASDANWGRILAAVGRAGVELDIARVGLSVNGVTILTGGEPDPAYTEAAGSRAMAAEEIDIDIDLGSGSSEYTLWTSDLSHDYVSINADYRT